MKEQNTKDMLFMDRKPVGCYCILIILMLPLGLFAQLSLPPFFGDHMVLQRDSPLHIWGKGKPGTKVQVLLDGQGEEMIVEKDSTWSLYLNKQKAVSTPLQLQITNDEEVIVINNVLIGDVWLCIGQSNMEWPLQKEIHYPAEAGNTEQGLLRFYNPTYGGKNVYNETFGDSIVKRLNTDTFYLGHWQKSNRNSAKSMSAVGYYFGKKILQEVSVPIGLVNLSIGGAPLEAFISPSTLSDSRNYRGKVINNWLYNRALPKWVRERGGQNLKKAKDVPVDSLGPNHAYKPGFAYRAGVKPLTAMPIKGIIWYQGESNAQEVERVDEYASLQALMVRDYRKGWGNPKMPFYWVQLSSIDTKDYNAHLWPQFRNEQRKLLSMVPHGGMAVTSDIGEKYDVHPKNKKAVGERLARWALNKEYGHDIVPSGPLVKKVKFDNDRLIVSFEYDKGLNTSNGLDLRGFSIDGSKEINAYIQNSEVVIPVQDRPGYLYYNWQAWASGNLVNSEQLPASTFRIPVTYDR